MWRCLRQGQAAQQQQPRRQAGRRGAAAAAAAGQHRTHRRGELWLAAVRVQVAHRRAGVEQGVDQQPRKGGLANALAAAHGHHQRPAAARCGCARQRRGNLRVGEGRERGGARKLPALRQGCSARSQMQRAAEVDPPRDCIHSMHGARGPGHGVDVSELKLPHKAWVSPWQPVRRALSSCALSFRPARCVRGLTDWAAAGASVRLGVAQGAHRRARGAGRPGGLWWLGPAAERTCCHWWLAAAGAGAWGSVDLKTWKPAAAGELPCCCWPGSAWITALASWLPAVPASCSALPGQAPPVIWTGAHSGVTSFLRERARRGALGEGSREDGEEGAARVATRTSAAQRTYLPCHAQRALKDLEQAAPHKDGALRVEARVSATQPMRRALAVGSRARTCPGGTSSCVNPGPSLRSQARVGQPVGRRGDRGDGRWRLAPDADL
jgi:hypothetical protein